MHLNFVKLKSFLFILTFLGFFLTEIVDLLKKLLVLLKVCLKLIHGFLGYFVIFVFFLADGGDSFDVQIFLFFFGSCQIFLFLFLFLFLFILFFLISFTILYEQLRGFSFFFLDKMKELFIFFINRYIIIRLRRYLLLFIFTFQLQKSFSCLLFHPSLFFFLPSLTLFAEKCLLRYRSYRWIKTIYVKSFIAIIANDKFDIVVIEIFLTYLTSHILKSFIPFFSTDISRSKSQVPFAFFGPTKTFSQRCTVYIKLIVKGKFLIFFDISQSKNTDTDLSKNVPFLCDAVRFAGMVDKSCQIAFVGRIDDLPFRSFHEVSACRFTILFEFSFANFRVS